MKKAQAIGDQRGMYWCGHQVGFIGKGKRKKPKFCNELNSEPYITERVGYSSVPQPIWRCKTHKPTKEVSGVNGLPKTYAQA